LHRIPLPFDYLPQHGFLIQAMHERLAQTAASGFHTSALSPIRYCSADLRLTILLNTTSISTHAEASFVSRCP
jgi:hypothetical protein